MLFVHDEMTSTLFVKEEDGTQKIAETGTLYTYEELRPVRRS